MTAPELIDTLARMTRDGEDGYQMAHEDAFDALNRLILEARAVQGERVPAFNVIGYHDDTGQAFAEIVQAKDAHEAMRTVARKLRRDGAPDAWIVGAVMGIRHLETQDNGAVVCINDLDDEDDAARAGDE